MKCARGKRENSFDSSKLHTSRSCVGMNKNVCFVRHVIFGMRFGMQVNGHCIIHTLEKVTLTLSSAIFFSIYLSPAPRRSLFLTHSHTQTHSIPHNVIISYSILKWFEWCPMTIISFVCSRVYFSIFESFNFAQPSSFHCKTLQSLLLWNTILTHN